MLTCGSALAAFPDKAITIVVPTTGGGTNDAMVRMLKQPVEIDNKAGANGVISSEFVIWAPPDGHTLILGYITTHVHAMNPALQKLRYDPVKDFEPVGMVGTSAKLMVVHPTVKASNTGAVPPRPGPRPGSVPNRARSQVSINVLTARLK